MSSDELVHERTVDALAIVGVGSWAGGYMAASMGGIGGLAVGITTMLLSGGVAFRYLPSAETVALQLEEHHNLQGGDES